MTLILFNPKAHNGKGEAEARAWVAEKGYNAEDMKNILEIEDPVAYSAQFTEEDKVILIGGDGTLTRFADALRDVDIRFQVYYTASGTGNDFLRDVEEFGKEDPVKINRYLKDLPRVYVNGEEHVFVNGIGYGLDGYCCEVGDQLQAQSDKPVKYSSIAIKGLLGKYHVCNAEVTVDGVTKSYKKVWLAPTMNGKYYGGGLMIAPEQDRLNPERLVTSAVVHHSGRIHTLLIFPSISKGTQGKYKKIYEARVGHEVTVRFDKPCALQIDGETVLNVTEYTVRSAHRIAELAKEKEQEAAKV